jgi:hypothetical protein
MKSGAVNGHQTSRRHRRASRDPLWAQAGWGVLRPVGDRLPYDLAYDIGGQIVRIQVKCAWYDAAKGNYVIDTRRTRTNRREMVREVYQCDDFDFALAYIEELDLFYVFPVQVFIGYGSEIHLVEAEKRQRRPKSAEYRDAWGLITRQSLSIGAS